MSKGKEKIVLGSGHTYIMTYTGDLPDISDIEKEENRLGRTSGGASLEYTPESYTATDDFGVVTKTIITKEEALLKLGICTFNGDTLEKLASTARVTTEGNKRIVKIGGIGNFSNQKYVIHFVHEDETKGDVRVTIVGMNQSGWTLTFQKDSETVLNAEFKALPCDDDGTLIVYKEEDATITQ